MKYRYYRCLQYNEKWGYCSHRYLALAPGEVLNEYLNKYEIATECTSEEYFNNKRG